MRRNLEHRVMWLAIGGCLLIACSGCMRNITVRDASTIETNGAASPNETSADGNANAAGDQTECVTPGAPCPGACPQEVCPRPGPLGGRFAGGLGAGMAPPEASEGYYNPPRFFPVPTKPVFSPRTDLTSIPTSAALLRQPESPVTPDGTIPREIHPLQMPPPLPEPEEVPAPPAQDPPPQKAGEATKTTDASQPTPGWFFPRSVAALKSNVATRQSADGGKVKK